MADYIVSEYLKIGYYGESGQIPSQGFTQEDNKVYENDMGFHTFCQEPVMWTNISL